MQPQLFHETVYDALRSAVAAAGGAKKVGPVLFPSKSDDAAANLVRDCLNPARSERFDPEQVVHVFRLAREAGYHDAKHWLDTELGYAPTPPVDPDDQAAELARVIAAAGDQLRRATEALGRLQKGIRR